MKLKSTNLVQIETIRKNVYDKIGENQNLLLAFSGGLDSTVLLDILASWRTNRITIHKKNKESTFTTLRAVHVHHGLSPYADSWVEHCEQQCRLYNVIFRVIYISINSKKHNVENIARQKRYFALKDTLLSNEILLTAHHLDDQIETFFLALKRGSGPAGLSSMPIRNNTHGYCLLRPLLEYDRKLLRVYAEKNHLIWIEDNTNKDISYDRNFLRLNILPLFQERWFRFSNSVARSINLCAEQEKLLRHLLAEKINTSIQPDGSLKLSVFKIISDQECFVLLRHWLERHQVQMPSLKQLKCILKEIIFSRSDAIPELQFGKWLIRRFHNKIYVLLKNNIFSLEKVFLTWVEKNKILLLPHNLGILTRYVVVHKRTQNICIINKKIVQTLFSANRQSISSEFYIKKSCMIRTPFENEKVTIQFGKINGSIHIIGNQNKKSMKKIWKELEVPPWLRQRIPLLFYNKKLIAAIGVFITIDGKIPEQYKSWKICWLQK